MTAPVTTLLGSIALLAIPTPTATPAGPTPAQDTAIEADLLAPATFGRSWVESMEAVIEREKAALPMPGYLIIPEPESPKVELKRAEKRAAEALMASGSGTGQQFLGGGGTPPVLGTNFVGPAIGGPGGGWIPPDTCGAVGINHFVSVVNSNISVWSKTTGARLTNVGQTTFWNVGGSLGDGRAVFDPHSQRFILLTEDFTSRIYLAVSTTSDPMGTWFKTSFITNTAGTTDAGTWPDYPTLGVDANGIYTAMYQVGSGDTMTIFAVDKAPLISPTPSLGTVFAYRGLAWEGAIHPCVTYGNPGFEYFVSRPGSSSQRLYRVSYPFTAGSMTNMGTHTVPTNSSPPNAPQLGGGTLDTLDGRLMNSVFRNGHVWTANGVAGTGGRAACRWYQVNPLNAPATRLVQSGVVDDPTLHYFFPGIAVNASGHMVVGFSGSHANQFPGVYVTGRRATDATGQTAPPILVKAGETSNNDGRYGDYSLTSVDPTDDLTFWTIQEYGRGGSWGTWIAQVVYDSCAVVPPSNFCVTSPNTAGPGATMFWQGSTDVSNNDFVLQAFGLPPDKAAIIFYGMDLSAFAPFGNGTRCVANPFFRLPLTQSNAFGDVTFPLDLNNLPSGGEIGAGETWGFQCWYRDPQAPGASTNVSDGLETHWCP